MTGARPDWGGNAQDWGAIAPPCPMLATALNTHIAILVHVYAPYIRRRYGTLYSGRNTDHSANNLRSSIEHLTIRASRINQQQPSHNLQTQTFLNSEYRSRLGLTRLPPLFDTINSVQSDTKCRPPGTMSSSRFRLLPKRGQRGSHGNRAEGTDIRRCGCVCRRWGRGEERWEERRGETRNIYERCETRGSERKRERETYASATWLVRVLIEGSERRQTPPMSESRRLQKARRKRARNRHNERSQTPLIVSDQLHE